MDLIWDNLPLLAAIGAIAFLWSWAAKWQQQRGRFLGSPASATISWLGSYTEAFQRALNTIAQLGAALIDADATRGYILAGKGMNVRSWGTTIRIELLTQEGVTFVKLHAGPAASLFDFGESQRLVNEFIRMWEAQPSQIAG